MSSKEDLEELNRRSISNTLDRRQRRLDSSNKIIRKSEWKDRMKKLVKL